MWILLIIAGVGYKPTSSQFLFSEAEIQAKIENQSIPILESDNEAIKRATKGNSWMWSEPLGGLVGGICLGYLGLRISPTGLLATLGAGIGYVNGVGLGVAFTGHFIEKERENQFSWLAALGGSIVGGAIVTVVLFPPGSHPITAAIPILGSVICYRLTLKKDNTENTSE